MLFADVVKSMEIAATLGAERLRELMTELVERSGVVVQRYGGTMNQFTGDGFMALFGAPSALEDHALRACLAALDIQSETHAMAANLMCSDGIALGLRVGLNSGEVVVGEIDSGPMHYTVSGEQVGLAQRMESAAEPRGVMLSESTARLVAADVTLGEPHLVRIKNVGDPIRAHPLLAVDGERHRSGRTDCRLIGRERERAAIEAAIKRAHDGCGGTVTVVGPPGIGKSRLVRESIESVKSVVTEIYCESHTRDVPFHVIARAVRKAEMVGGLDPDEARAHIRDRHSDRDEADLLLLYDLLGIRDVSVPMPDMSPDARRKRLVEILKDGAVTNPSPAVYVVEDVHWIDAVSESLLAELAAELRHTRSLMIFTFRPEYQGPLSFVDGLQGITLEPLDDHQSAELTVELLGEDPSVAELSRLISERASGVPFFAEEIVRDLAEQGVVTGARGAYRCTTPVADIDVPATVQAALGARIDRLGARAKRTLHAAAVIGAQFDAELVCQLTGDDELAELVAAELIEHVAGATGAHYAFRHPLIQKVAYDSQLRADRSKLHRRLAASLEQVDENAALLASQWEAAGDFGRAYLWHMRAGSWLNYRDHSAAYRSWQRARDAADRLPADDPDRLSKRIAPRTVICATTFRVGGQPAETGFAELKELTTRVGDKRSLAIGMAGYLTTLAFMSHHREASELASEFVTLVESIGEPAMTVGLMCAAAQAKYEAGENSECLAFADRVIDLAKGDAAMGDIVVASPLAWAYTLRGTAKMCLGRDGWLADMDAGGDLAASFDVQSQCNVALYKNVLATQYRLYIPDGHDLAFTADLLRVGIETHDSTPMTLVKLIRAVTLLNHSPEHRDEGMDLLTEAYGTLARLSGGLRRFADIEIARHRAAIGDLGGAVALAQATIDEQFATGEMISRGTATTVLVEALLRRRANGDLDSARAAIDRLAAVPVEPGFVLHKRSVEQLRRQLAAACG